MEAGVQEQVRVVEAHAQVCQHREEAVVRETWVSAVRVRARRWVTLSLLLTVLEREAVEAAQRRLFVRLVVEEAL